MRVAASVVLALVLTSVLAFVAVADDSTPMLPLPLVVHVPGGVPDANAVALLEGLREAYAPARICFAVAYRALPESRRWQHTVRERRALRTLAVDHALNAFLVDHADDPSPAQSTVRTAARFGLELTGRLGGAHVPAPGLHPATFVIVTRDGSRLSLAHEVGHFLGAGHSGDPLDIMSYASTRRRFDAADIRGFRARARRYVDQRELTRLDPTSCTLG